MAPQHTTIPKPRLTLRVGFAGNRQLTRDESLSIFIALDTLYKVITRHLLSLSPEPQGETVAKATANMFYADEPPLLQLVMGLCEGADALAVQRLEATELVRHINDSKTPRASRHDSGRVEARIAAVIPTPYDQYRSTRDSDFLPEFDRQSALCDWVLTLDGLGRGSNPDQKLGSLRSARGYRGQGAILLRHSDILIAAANPARAGKAGGTLDTVERAQRLKLPVLFINTAKLTDAIYLIRPEDNLYEALERPANFSPDELTTWLTQTLVAPGAMPEQSRERAIEHGSDKASEKANDQTSKQANQQAISVDAQCLADYFSGVSEPVDNASRRLNQLRQFTSSWYERRFKPKSPRARQLENEPVKEPVKKAATQSKKSDSPFVQYRQRASKLSAHYAGLYRGTYILLYAAAVLAIVLAALSLVLLTGQTVKMPESMLQGVAIAQQQVTSLKPSISNSVLLTVLGLAFVKLGLVMFITRSTRLANTRQWSERAVNFRYLAERLRAMIHLPSLGSHHALNPSTLPFLSQDLQQSHMDWLFHSMVRAVNPTDTHRHAPTPRHCSRHRPATKETNWLTVEPLSALHEIRDDWVKGQIDYHHNTAVRIETMNHWSEWISVCLSRSVIALVMLDIVLILGKLLHLFPVEWTACLKTLTPWLIFLTAVFPAAVAALSGIKAQSEYQRLAGRSRQVLTFLGGDSLKRDKGLIVTAGGQYEALDTLIQDISDHRQMPQSDPGAWTRDALLQTETVADYFAQEVADWSVLYAKEITDPG